MTYEEAIKVYAQVMEVSEKEAKEDAERLVIQQMKQEGVPREFAEATFIEEQEDVEPTVIKEMERKAKASGATKVKARAVDAFGKKRERTVKEDAEKLQIIATIAQVLTENITERVEIVNKQQKIDLFVGENHYTVTLTKHRPPKKE